MAAVAPAEDRNPLVSVVVPAFNAEGTIARCLESLAAQTLSDWEAVVVDDGSTDGTADAVEAFAAHDPRVRLLRQENLGSGAARNAGVATARGEFLAFVDADDAVEPDMLEALVQAARAHDAQIAVCQADRLLFRDGKLVQKLGELALPPGPDVVSGHQAAGWLFDFVAPNLNSMTFKLVSRALWDESGVRFPENKRYVEDMPTSAGLLLAARRVALVRRDLYHYIHEGDTRSTFYAPESARDIMANLDDMLRFAEAAGYEPTLDNFALGMCFSAEKHLVWAAKDSDPATASEAREAIERQKAGRTPDRARPLPWAQRAKVQVAYRNLTPAVCAVVGKLKWIPFVKYLV